MSQRGNSVELEVIVVEEGFGRWEEVWHPKTIGSLEADKIPLEMTVLNT